VFEDPLLTIAYFGVSVTPYDGNTKLPLSVTLISGAVLLPLYIANILDLLVILTLADTDPLYIR
jgi:hypothetical protein